MSIFSDAISTFGSLPKTSSFLIYEYSEDGGTSDIAFGIYGVYSIQYQSSSSVANKPIEGGDYRSDSRQIQPYQFTITGALMDDEDTSQSIEETIDAMNGYRVGIKLLSIFNDFTFQSIEPVALVDFSFNTETEKTIPQVSLTFRQVQVGELGQYSTDLTRNAREPENKPTRS